MDELLQLNGTFDSLQLNRVAGSLQGNEVTPEFLQFNGTAHTSLEDANLLVNESEDIPEATDYFTVKVDLSDHEFSNLKVLAIRDNELIFTENNQNFTVPISNSNYLEPDRLILFETLDGPFLRKVDRIDVLGNIKYIQISDVDE